MLTSERIKAQFLNYYSSLGHDILPSESLVPQSPDPTLLFINSTMARFKEIYGGEVAPAQPMLATFQRCLRVGGRPTLYAMEHELEDVGKGQSLTLFEQVGTCAFGAYFRPKAIEYIWHFLTEELALTKDRFWITIYDQDDDTYQCWKRIGIPEGRIIRLGAAHWWEIEPTGVCGPCTHFVYDRGESYKYRCGRDDCGPTCMCGRFLDLGDIVFLQYMRMADGTVRQLPRRNIDCALGLERLTVVVEDVPSIFEISSFRPLLRRLEELSGHAYGSDPQHDVAMRAIADHVRCLTFAISDGVHPGNEGRGYVLRRVLRRAVRCGWALDIEKPFLHNLVDTVVDTMSEGYAFLVDSRVVCRGLVQAEEQQFLRTLRNNIRRFQRVADKAESSRGYLPGRDVFKLYDTYGLPLEFIRMLAAERGLEVDEGEFEKLLEEQRQRSRMVWQQKATQKIQEEGEHRN